MKRALLALGLVLGACSQAPEEPEAQPMTIEVEGELGAPTLTSVDGDPTEETILAIEGTGRVLAAESPILYTVSSYSDERQKLAGGDTPILSTAAEAPIDATGLAEGSRVLSVNPQEGGAEILILDILHTSARGEARETGGPFTVTSDENGVPTLSGTSEPARLSTQIVIRGEGPQVQPEDELYVQYSVYRASDGQLVDSTWGEGPILLSLNETFEGLRTGAAESPVGSRLLVQVPAGEAQGTDDLVIILDILALG